MSRKMLEEQRKAMEVMEQLEYTNEMFSRYETAEEAQKRLF